MSTGIRIYFTNQKSMSEKVMSIGLYLKLTNLAPDTYMCGVAATGVTYYDIIAKMGKYRFVDNYHGLTSFVGRSVYHDVKCSREDSVKFEFKTVPCIESTSYLSGGRRMFKLSRLAYFDIIRVILRYNNQYNGMSPCEVGNDRLVRIKSDDVKCRRSSIRWLQSGVDVTFSCSRWSGSEDYDIILDIGDGSLEITYILTEVYSRPIVYIFEPYVCYVRAVENIANSSTIYTVSAKYSYDPEYPLPDVYSALTDADVNTCLKLKHEKIDKGITFKLRASEWRRVRSLKVIMGDAAYVSDIDMNIRLLSVNGSYESDNESTRWTKVLNSCLEYFVYEKIINITGYLIY